MTYILPFPGGSDGRVQLQCRRPGFDPWVAKIPWRRHGSTFQCSYLLNPQRQRSLSGYSPCVLKESDKTEQLYIAHSNTQLHKKEFNLINE